MKRIKLVIGICILYLFVVFGGTGLMTYFDSKFYGALMSYPEVHAEQEQDDSEYHYQQWIQRKQALNYRVVYVFPENDKKTKLVTVYDPVYDVVCYTLQNKPYYFKTGLNCFPKWMLENGVK